MKFETFKAGRWITRYQYKSFEPVPVDHDWTWENAGINTLLESANRAHFERLGVLNQQDKLGVGYMRLNVTLTCF
jgi:hypothetical protein